MRLIPEVVLVRAQGVKEKHEEQYKANGQSALKSENVIAVEDESVKEGNADIAKNDSVNKTKTLSTVGHNIRVGRKSIGKR